MGGLNKALFKARGYIWQSVMIVPFIMLVLGLFLTQCSKKEAVLSIAIGGAPNEIDYWEDVISDFEKQTGIKVRLLRHPTDTDQRRQRLVVSLKAREKDPDVFLMDVAWVGQFAASGWLLPIDDLLNSEQLKKEMFFSSVINNVDFYNGNLIALPVYIDCGLLYYRKDLLEKYGYKVPSTWEDLVNIAVKVQESERNNNPRFYGFVWQGAQYEGLVCTFLEFITANGGGIYDSQGDLILFDKRNIEASRFMRDIIQTYKISPPNTYTEMKEEEVRLYFENGDALFERNWPYAWKLHEGENSPVKGKVGVAVLPKFKAGRPAATLGGWHIGISAYSDKKAEAKRLVSFIESYKVQKRLVLNLGWNPGRKDIYEDPEVIKTLPHLKVLKEAFRFSVARPIVPYYTQLSEILQEHINGILAGKDVEKELKQAYEKIKRIEQFYNER